MDAQVEDDKLYAQIITWFFVALMLFTTLSRVPFFSKYRILIAAGSVAIPLLFLLKLFIKSKFRIRYGYILLAFMIITLLYTISLFRGVPLNSVLLYYFSTIYGILLLYFTFCIKNLDILYEEFVKKSLYITIISVFILLSNRSINPYNMRFSYILSIALYFQTIELVNSKNKMLNLIFILVDIALILVYGSRGSILCYSIFLVIYILFNNKKTFYKLLLIGGISAFYLYLDKVLQFIGYILERFNIMSRTLSLMISNIGHTSGRDIILEKSLELIGEHPVFGLGVAGEFKYMNEYPHNILLELFLHWGVVFGFAIFVILLFIIISSFIKAHSKNKLLLLVFISYGFVVLFFSGTYLSWDGFYILLGICLRTLVNKKVNYNEK